MESDSNLLDNQPSDKILICISDSENDQADNVSIKLDTLIGS